MKNKSPFREFIEQLPQIDGLNTDREMKAVDQALAAWITRNYPQGFDFSHKRRDLIIAMVKKNAQIVDLIKKSPFKAYINAVIVMKWEEIYQKYINRGKGRERAGKYDFILEFACEIFSLGYALKCLEAEKCLKQHNTDKPE